MRPDAAALAGALRGFVLRAPPSGAARTVSWTAADGSSFTTGSFVAVARGR